MLFRILLSPSVFSEIPKEDYPQKLFCALVIRLLHDLTENCVILVDDTKIFKMITNALEDKWPIKFRKPAKELLRKLREENRIVKVPGYCISPDISTECCQHLSGIAIAYPPTAIVFTEKCSLEINRLPNAFNLLDYGTSDFSRSRKKSSITLTQGEWNQEEFELKVLIPLFQDAKTIQIYDRWIGRSSLNNFDNYQNTLKWLINLFLKKSRHGSQGIFEVYTGLDTYSLSTTDLKSAVSKLRSFENDIQQTLPQFKLYIKKEISGSAMVHARYLITDQRIAISLDRGFDLLLPRTPYPSLLRDVHISYCSEHNKISKAAKLLIDL